MNINEDMLSAFVRKGANTWANVELTKHKKVKVMSQIKESLQSIANPRDENEVKIEIIRQTCRLLSELYPNYSKDAEKILNQFETHLRINSMAVLPFHELDELTFKIFVRKTLMQKKFN
ncbi:hypothetical protein DMA11_13500 [Marinilabiliaceae bacterium JC017]|nr:hypothetical protein DMA11_13500 [Marinilabiliaceae bacterium JC017]